MKTQENSFNAPVSNRIVNLLGQEIIELLISSNTLTLYDIDSTSEINSKTVTATHFYGYKINEVITEPTLSTLQDLKSFFLGLSSYNWLGPVAGCALEPGFAITFGNSQSDNLLNIFICFRCGKLLFQKGNEKEGNEIYFSGYDILLILFNDAFKDSKKAKSIMSNFSMLDDSDFI